MKLSQIQEARYSGEHPLITKINDLVKNNERNQFNIQMKIEPARELISSQLGEPKVYPADDESYLQYSWTFDDMIITLTDQPRRGDPLVQTLNPFR